MARAAEDGEEPGRERREDRDLLRVAAQELLRVFQHDGEAAGCLQEARAGDDREDGQHDIDRRHARLILEYEREDYEADAADDGQADAPVADADEQTGQEDKEPKQHFHRKLL